MTVSRYRRFAQPSLAWGALTAFVAQVIASVPTIEAQQVLAPPAGMAATSSRLAQTSKIDAGNPLPWRYTPAFDVGGYTQADTSGSSYTTVCVRMCDGYYFPISHSASQGRFHHDEEACQSRCGASEARLFFYPNKGGGDMSSAIDLTGRSYASLRSAFLHTRKLVSGCTCRPEPWTQEALDRHRQYAIAGTGDVSAGSTGIGSFTVVAGNYDAARASSDAVRSSDGEPGPAAEPRRQPETKANPPPVFWTVSPDKAARASTGVGGASGSVP